MGNGKQTGKIIIAAAAATLCAAGIAAATLVICKRLYEKTYFTAGTPSAV